MRSIRRDEAYFDNIPIHKIKPNGLNPRKIFNSSDIQELAKSFKEYGVIQPIIVYPHNSKFVIICGERRWRAAKKANLEQMPAVVHSAPPSNEKAISLALIENLHRKDIDVLNEAAAIRGLVDSYGWSQLNVADKLGVSIGYVRNRYLLMRFTDIIEAFENKEISFSEAIELSTIESPKSRAWLLQRIKNKEFSDFQHLSSSVARYRNIKKAIDMEHFIKHPLDRTKVEFGVPGLPYCDQNCSNYLRLSWNEKRHFDIKTEKPGWSEYCLALNNGCYERKKEVKRKYIEKLSRLKEKRPIIAQGWESMLWFEYRNNQCRNCKYMVDASDFELMGKKIKEGIYAYCISPKPDCYDKRSKAYLTYEQKKKELLSKREDERKQRLLDEIDRSTADDGNSSKKTLTKRECTYLILQYICYIGGKPRLEEFARKHSLNKNMPSRYGAQLNYVRNKLLDHFTEAQLQEILFSEAASSGAYSTQEIQPMYFNRKDQREVPLIT